MTDSNSKNRRIKRRNSFIFFSRTLRILNCSGWKLDVKSFALVEQVWGYWRVWPGKWWFPVWSNRRLPSLWCGSYVYKATFRISLSIWIEIVVGCRSGLLSIVSCSFDPRPFSSQFASKCLLPLSLSLYHPVLLLLNYPYTWRANTVFTGSSLFTSPRVLHSFLLIRESGNC